MNRLNNREGIPVILVLILSMLFSFPNTGNTSSATGADTSIQEAIISALRIDLKRRGISLSRDIDPSELQIQASIPSAPSSWKLQVRSASFDIVRNATRFLVEQNASPRRHPLLVVVRHHREVVEWSARREIGRGDKLVASDLVRTPIVALDLISDPLKLEEIEGRTATRRIRAGEAITKNLVTLPPTILAGSAARLITRHSRYRTVMLVISLENGTTGQRIRYRNPQTKQVNVATVNGRGELEVGL